MKFKYQQLLFFFPFTLTGPSVLWYERGECETVPAKQKGTQHTPQHFLYVISRNNDAQKNQMHNDFLILDYIL